MGVVIGRLDSQVEKIFLKNKLSTNGEKDAKMSRAATCTCAGETYGESPHRDGSRDAKMRKKREEDDIIL